MESKEWSCCCQAAWITVRWLPLRPDCNINNNNNFGQHKLLAAVLIYTVFFFCGMRQTGFGQFVPHFLLPPPKATALIINKSFLQHRKPHLSAIMHGQRSRRAHWTADAGRRTSDAPQLAGCKCRPTCVAAPFKCKWMPCGSRWRSWRGDLSIFQKGEELTLKFCFTNLSKKFKRI